MPEREVLRSLSAPPPCSPADPSLGPQPRRAHGNRFKYTQGIYLSRVSRQMPTTRHTPWYARTSLLDLCLHPLQCLELVLNMVEPDRVWEPSESEAPRWNVPRRTSGPVQGRLGRRDSECVGSRATGLAEPQRVQSHFSGELRSCNLYANEKA